MKEKECEFSYKAEAGLGQYQVWNQKIEKKTIEISIRTKIALVEQHDWNQKKEKYGSPRFRAGTNRGPASSLQRIRNAKNQECKEYKKVCRLW
jgi:hypothetical protein